MQLTKNFYLRVVINQKQVPKSMEMMLEILLGIETKADLRRDEIMMRLLIATNTMVNSKRTLKLRLLQVEGERIINNNTI